MNEIYKLKRKYGNSIEEILEYGEKAQKKLTKLLNYDKDMAEAKACFGENKKPAQKSRL